MQIYTYNFILRSLLIYCTHKFNYLYFITRPVELQPEIPQTSIESHYEKKIKPISKLTRPNKMLAQV